MASGYSDQGFPGLDGKAGSGPVLLLEPFYGGSHKQLVDLLIRDQDWTLWTLPPKKWHWKSRTAALIYSQTLPREQDYRVLFCSSVLNLCELVALRPDLARLKKVLYFHENQLVYPRQKVHQRDFQYGYNQILSCLVADVVVFNSRFNMESFLSTIGTFLKQIPDHRPSDLDWTIRTKSRVLYFPLDLPPVHRFLPEHKLQKQPRVSHDQDLIQSAAEEQKPSTNYTSSQDLQSDQSTVAPTESEPQQGPDPSPDPGPEPSPDPEAEPCPYLGPGPELSPDQSLPLHVVWPHRWEHDKNPELLFSTLLKLKEQGLDFRVSVLGETFTDVPDVFGSSRDLLRSHLVHWGFLRSRQDYLRALCESDLVLSTARHEFYGVAMLEAVHCGCFPLCPDALVYPEIFPDQYRYRTPQQLFKMLARFCKRPDLVRTHTVQVDMSRFSWSMLRSEFEDLLSGGRA